ncbi:KR domain protein [Leptospira broomii serovar Hurstbridge str. 5399]|uniref:KR domain protein n=1 Tax=Leptospira broomii serovar Hurstbridge str. 5399 TaxID=1049789 RepID=T0F6X0_9LEPT|nr:SDR family oxidoreductase [Leptospira broomii]EQA46890.1 KR domain protein [Leptospira broomii serovar Hurstbridge str. 5399]
MNEFYKDKVVWITGASSGIGEALVKELSGTGAKIVLSARRKEELERVQLENHLNNSNSLVLPLDLNDYKSLAQYPEKVIRKFGQIDVLINNGGISQRSLAHETDFSTYETLMNVNFYGNIALTLSSLPFLRDRKKGWIASISSVAGKLGVPYRTGYSAAKAALTGFFEALRAENHSQGIRITLVYPGFIQTQISQNALKGDGQKNGAPNLHTKATIKADECARKILNAIRDEKLEVVIAGPKEGFAIWMHKYFPSFFARILSRIKVT